MGLEQRESQWAPDTGSVRGAEGCSATLEGRGDSVRHNRIYRFKDFIYTVSYCGAKLEGKMIGFPRFRKKIVFK